MNEERFAKEMKKIQSVVSRALQKANTLTALAGGGKMSPTAVLIMKGERVELFSIKNATPNGTIDRVLNMIPEAVSHFTKKKEKKNEVREAALKEAKEAMKEEAETAALEAKVQNR